MNSYSCRNREIIKDDKSLTPAEIFSDLLELEDKVISLEKDKKEMKSKILYLRKGLIDHAGEMDFILDKLEEVGS
jgi:hypothetical protein